MQSVKQLDFSSPEKYASSVEIIRTKYFSRKVCEAKNLSTCHGKIIKSHSISRKFLKLIANNSKIYHFDDRLFGLISRNGKADVSKIGIERASTYHMFCSRHDNNLFSPIEDEELLPNEFQCQLLMFRSLMMEKYLKESQNLYLKEIIQQGISFFDNGLHYDLHQGVLMAINDFQSINSDIVCDLQKKDVSPLRALRIYFKKKPCLLCSGAFHPEFDFNGKKLTSLISTQPLQDVLSINDLPLSHNLNYNGVVVLAWRECENQSDSQCVIDSLHGISHESISNILIHFIFEYVENIYISPSWWESIDNNVKEKILELHSTSYHSPLNWRNISIEYANWK